MLSSNIAAMLLKGPLEGEDNQKVSNERIYQQLLLSRFVNVGTITPPTLHKTK
jgi:hypothetical protein